MWMMSLLIYRRLKRISNSGKRFKLGGLLMAAAVDKEKEVKNLSGILSDILASNGIDIQDYRGNSNDIKLDILMKDMNNLGILNNDTYRSIRLEISE
jgi:hypothetical protein